MRRRLLLLPVLALLLVAYGSPRVDADEEAKKAPAKPLSLEEAVAQTIEAAAAGDTATLATLAAADNPDPWTVVDELCHRGAHDAAEAFAKASDRPDVAKLPAYVTAARTRESDEASRQMLAALMEAMRVRSVDRAQAAIADLGPLEETVVRMRLAHGRGVFLQAIGKFKEAEDVLLAAADVAARMGWLRRAFDLYTSAGTNAYRTSSWARARDHWKKAQELAVLRRNRADAAGSLSNLGIVYQMLGEYDQALAAFEAGAQGLAEMGEEVAANQARSNIGNIHFARGDFDLAIAAHERVLAVYEKHGNKVGTARTLGNLANAYYGRGDFPRALATNKKARAQQEAMGDALSVARTLGNIGLIHSAMGDYAKAIRTYAQARAKSEALDDRGNVAGILINTATALAALGKYAVALSTLEEGIAIAKSVGQRQWELNGLASMGSIHASLGAYEKALANHQQARAQMSEIGDKAGAARALTSIGSMFVQAGRLEEALAVFGEALAEQEAISDKSNAASTRLQMAHTQARLGNAPKAFEMYEDARERFVELKNRAEVGQVHLGAGQALLHMGRLDEARDRLKQAERTGRSRRTPRLRVQALVELAALDLREGNPAAALQWARQAMTPLEDLLGGLGEEQGATARGLYADLFAVGALAAAEEEDAPELFNFLESGRAGALLDALGKREMLRWRAESLPPELLAADREARANERAKRHAYDRAIEKGKRKERRAARDALDAATEVVREVGERIQRELKRQASVHYPRAKLIEDVQDVIREQEALVVYGLAGDQALALVLRIDDVRIVRLGPSKAMREACEALDASQPSTSPGEALTALRKLLVDPLELPDDVRQVLVSPEGVLCYLPFGALFEQPVAVTPSGTTHALLLEEGRARGKGILALGDPDYEGVSAGAQATYYRGRSLQKLPATRVEVETVGTTTLLGADASEEGLRKALDGATVWRAVHFACHGLVDVERPMLSSLALSRSEADDGFLTALEILRSEIPTDLAVLSACETGKGRIVKGEGIVGLTRAFMFAGAPRVLCSLWKVDDAATRALMVKFYELWAAPAEPGQPSMSAAEALRQAQAFVRSHPNHPEWKHPYYWAAWVLWGLPE